MKNNRGIVLAATLIILVVLIALIAGVLAVSYSSTDLQSSRNESQQALYLAEAGVNRMIQQFRDHPKENPDTFIPSPFSENVSNVEESHVGNFTVNLDKANFKPPASNNYEYDYDYPVIATGRVHVGDSREITRTIKVILSHNSSGIWDRIIASPKIDGENHYGDELKDVTYGTGYNTANNGPLAGVAASQLPEPDWVAYHDFVKKNYSSNHLYGNSDPPAATDISLSSGNTYTKTFNQNDTPLNGYYYIHGNVELSGKVTLNGTLIATGNISIASGATVTTTMPSENEPYCDPALIAQGEITVQGGGSTVNGVIWAEGKITLGSPVNGAVYSMTDVVVKDDKCNIHYGIGNYTPDIYRPRFFKAPTGSVPVINPRKSSWQEIRREE